MATYGTLVITEDTSMIHDSYNTITESNPFKFATFTNNSNQKVKVTKVKMYLATGNSEGNQIGNYGTIAGKTGDGGNISFKLKQVKSSTNSDIVSKTISNSIKTSVGTEGRYFPKENCSLYEFTFTNPIVMNAGESIQIYGYISNTNENNILVFNYENMSVTDVLVEVPYIWRWNGSKWEKILFAHKYDATSKVWNKLQYRYKYSDSKWNKSGG